MLCLAVLLSAADANGFTTHTKDAIARNAQPKEAPRFIYSDTFAGLYSNFAGILYCYALLQRATSINSRVHK